MSPSTVPDVSILMPCYNAENTLKEALQSITAQTFRNYELVVVDDGSTDESLQLLNEWAERDERIHVISRTHSGIISSLNVGLAGCQADYIARMDADDRSHPERLAEQVAYLDSHPEVVVVSCEVRGFPQDQVREGFRIYIDWLNSLVTNEQIRREIFIESPLVHPSVVFRKDRIMQVGGYEEHLWAEDYDLWLRLYLTEGQFAKVPKMLFEWREIPDRLTRRDHRYAVENFLRAKAFYLSQGPLRGKDGVILWGAGMMGRRLSKHLIRQGCPLVAFIDIDPKKVRKTLRGVPVLPPEELIDLWGRYNDPGLLVAVGARDVRLILRQQLEKLNLREAKDWWFVA